MYLNSIFLDTCKKGNVSEIKFLIANSNNIQLMKDSNIKGRNGLSLAFMYNTVEMVKYLINEMKMFQSPKAFLLACEYNNIEMIKYLKNELKVNINKIDSDGDNGFTCACYGNTIEVVKYLAKYLNTKNCNHTGNNGFSLACCKNKNLETIKYLGESLDLYPNYHFDTINTSARNKNLSYNVQPVIMEY
jgi:hypothetical protein